MEEQKLKAALGPGPDCLSIEHLARFADGLLPDDERRSVAAHISACANCDAELSMLHAFANAAITDEESAVVRDGAAELRRRESEILGPHRGAAEFPLAGFRVWQWLRPALALAVVLLSVSGGYYLLNPAAPRLPADIGGSPDAMRAIGMTGLEPAGDQDAPPDRLRWNPVAGATRYHVRLTEVDRHEIWSGDTTDTGIEIPPEIKARISPAKTLVWQVTAYGASTTPMAESDLQRFRVAR